MRTAWTFFSTVGCVAFAIALVVVWNRPAPPPRMDAAEFQATIDLGVSGASRELGRVLERVTVGEPERRDDDVAVIPFEVTWSHPPEKRSGYALFRHQWRLVGMYDRNPPASLYRTQRAP